MTLFRRLLPGRLLPSRVLHSRTTGSTAPSKAPYTDDEREVIRALANGDQSRRDEAIAIYERHLRKGVFHQDPYFEFMSEITSPCPCFVVKGRARSAITGKPF
jgi:hypothetical protein